MSVLLITASVAAPALVALARVVRRSYEEDRNRREADAINRVVDQVLEAPEATR